MSELLTKQIRFAQMVGQLITWAYAHGYGLTFGEALRTQEQANLNAASGKGISNSLHILKLAVDLFAFRDGSRLLTVEDYRPLGEYWESIGGSWGGRFTTRPDADHFSLSHGGVK
jgi:hypothetical protein